MKHTLIVLLYVGTGTGVGEGVTAALSGARIYRGGTEGVIALECAVSWDAVKVEEILDVLRGKDVQITFFVSGRWADTHPALLRRMVDDGHEIGTLGYIPALSVGTDILKTDLSRSIEAIESVTGDPVGYYYAGARELNASLEASASLGLAQIGCTADLLSARGEAEDILLRASEHIFDGSIILMEPTGEAAKALPQLIDLIQETGFRIGTVGIAVGKET